MKCFLLITLLVSFQANAQWQVIDDTDSIPTTAAHVHGDYLFVTLSSTSLSGPIPDAFRRYSLTNPYQVQTIFDSLGVPYGPGEVESLGDYDGNLLALHRNLTTWFNYVMTSSDNGITWDEYYSFSSNSSPVRLRGSGNNLYIGADRTIYHSQDLSQPIDFVYYESQFVNTSMKPLLIHNGDGYFSQAAGLMRNGNVISSLEFRRMTKIGNDFYGFAEFDNFFKSTDLGVTWTLEAWHPFNYANIYELENFNGTLYACTEEGVYVSIDNGVNWVATNNGLPQYSGLTAPVYDITYYNGELFVATALGVFTLSESDVLSSLGTNQNEHVRPLVKVHPNPTNEKTFVHGSEFHDLSIVDQLGRDIPYTFIKNNEGIEIAIRDFDGVCFIRYTDENELLRTLRLLVQ
ncbi:MAG: hypothetical protein ACFHU9_00525 [Fluviicola sp.]